MKLPNWLSGRARIDHDTRFVGCWHRVAPAVEGEDAVELQFKDDGQLRYCVLVNDKWQIVKLAYRVDGNTLVTDQPSAPSEERTRFSFQADGALVLDYEGERTTYHRGECRAPVV